MIDHRKQFLEGLENNPSKKGNLHEWKALAEIIDNEGTNEKKCLKINFGNAMRLSRDGREVKDRFLEYGKVFYWGVITQKHDGFSEFDNTFRELDYFARHYQNSTEELVTQIKQLKAEKEQLKSEKEQLENKVVNLEEELEIERETNQASAEVMDRFYRRQFLFDSNIEQVRNELSKQILELNQENQTQKKEIQELKVALELTEQLVNLKIQEEQIENQFEVPSK